jgi:hypothetical protein
MAAAVLRRGALLPMTNNVCARWRLATGVVVYGATAV